MSVNVCYLSVKIPSKLELGGRSPLCVRMCLVRLLDVEEALPHVEYLNGRSPLCTRMCTDVEHFTVQPGA